MKLKKMLIGAALALSLTASAEAARIELGRYGDWDTYSLTFPNGTSEDPNLRWLCASRGFFTATDGEQYKVIFAFYNTGIAKLYIEDQSTSYPPGYNFITPVTVFNQRGQIIFSARGRFLNKSFSSVKQIGLEFTPDFIGAVMDGYTLRLNLPKGEVISFDISMLELNQSLLNIANRCIKQQPIMGE